MIVVDTETSGLDPRECGIVSLGAVDFFSPEREFYQECRLDQEDKIFEGIPGTSLRSASEINGFSEEEMRDVRKQSQKQLLEDFFRWCESCKEMILAGENIGHFDLKFIEIRSIKYNLKMPFGHRSEDLHSIAQKTYYDLHGRFLVDGKGKSGMSLGRCLEFCGLRDEREIHNALEDAKLEAECFSRLLKGEGLFPEYTKFPIPKYLRK